MRIILSKGPSRKHLSLRVTSLLDAYSASNNRSTIWIAVSVCALSVGCEIAALKEQGKSLVMRNFELRKARDFDAMMDDYAPTFFFNLTRDEWKDSILKVESQLGRPVSLRVLNWEARSRSGSYENGVRVTITCEVKYARFSATETFVLSGETVDSPLKFEKHTIESRGLSASVGS